MATRRSMSSKSTRKTSEKSAADRAASSAASAPPSKPQQPEKASASTSTSSSSDFLVVAQVLTAHGLRGELKIRVVTDFPRQRFRRGAQVFIAGAPYTVLGTLVQGAFALLRLGD